MASRLAPPLFLFLPAVACQRTLLTSPPLDAGGNGEFAERKTSPSDSAAAPPDVRGAWGFPAFGRGAHPGAEQTFPVQCVRG